MASDPHSDWSRRLQELEREIDSASATPKSSPDSTAPAEATPAKTTTAESVPAIWSRLQQWYEGLPTLGKALAFGGAAIAGFAVLQTVLRLVTALLTLGVLAGVVYGAYRLFVAPAKTPPSS